MPYWPFPMGVAALLVLFGARHGVAIVPAIILAAYIAMRGIIAYVPTPFIEVAGCTLWLICAAILCYKQAWVPGFFFALSGLTYPVLLVFGFRIEYMGTAPIIAAIFGMLALLGVGGGILGVSGNTAPHDSGGYFDRLAHYSLGMASRSMRD